MNSNNDSTDGKRILKYDPKSTQQEVYNNNITVSDKFFDDAKDELMK